MKKDLEKEIEKIKQRNRKVEIDKAWETSYVRKISIAVLTYMIVVIYSYLKDFLHLICFQYFHLLNLNFHFLYLD